MTDQEIRELPKVWVVGGDGALGDIGFQNASKVILQNRPNVKILMLDTQVYSNTGGQNSDSSTMLGGYDMNQFGVASQGKLIEKKSVAEAFTSGHGSPFVAQVSMANAAKLYKAMLDGLEYRGTAFFQCYTTCQPEHGVADNMSADQAKLVRDARGMPEFVFNPRQGETSQEASTSRATRPRPRLVGTKFKSTGETNTTSPSPTGPSPRAASASTQGDQGGGHRRELIPWTTCSPSSPRTTSSNAACSTRSTAVRARLRLSSSGRDRTARCGTTPSRARWSSSPSSAAKPGACSRARPAS
jgi:pyruvate/2-oxoacid:ferredoxin oxidoreductase beta subunit